MSHKVESPATEVKLSSVKLGHLAKQLATLRSQGKDEIANALLEAEAISQGIDLESLNLQVENLLNKPEKRLAKLQKAAKVAKIKQDLVNLLDQINSLDINLGIAEGYVIPLQVKAGKLVEYEYSPSIAIKPIIKTRS